MKAGIPRDDDDGDGGGGIKAGVMEGNLAAVRIIQGEMAPGLGEISATLSQIHPGAIGHGRV